jgi:DNA-binding CsgD family transcriptional regulator
MGLSRRELEILQRIAQGMTYKHIAIEFGVSYATVKNQSMPLYRKLNAFNNAHAVAIGKDLGLI